MFNQFPTAFASTSVVGTWDAVNTTFVNGQRQTALAVIQFKPDGTFVEGFDLANHASTYLGRYNFDGQRISFIIDSASGDGPQPVPFHQPASSRVFFDHPTTVRLNNDLTFAFQSTSVAPSDFVLPAAPGSVPFVSTPFGFSNPVQNNFAFDPFFGPHF